MFSRLANDPFRSAIPWESTLVFWADERCVPADHEDSNYRMAMYALLSKVPVPKENVYRIHGEIPSPDVAAREYSETVATAVAVTGSHNSHSLPNDLPRLDLVLLGLGEDGHTASLFPHSKALQSDRSIAAANYVETLGTYRITLTAAMINNARGVIFLVAGANKARALRNAFRCGYQPEAYPTQLIKPHNGLLLWMVDKASASLLVEEDPTLTDEFGNDQKTASDE
jgi:6-phosphogluconolactonase